MRMTEKHIIPEKFLQGYNAQSVESVIQQKWEEADINNPDTCIEKGFTKPDAEHFSIVLPPPNVTGQLHIGHAMMLVIEDTIVRFNRMLGKKTLWIPGTDHAAIATQSKVEKLLAKQKIRKHELGREKFLEKVREFAKESQDTIISQLKSTGAALDWSRLAYTLDETREHAVFTAFERLYEMGLIIQKDRVVNWDPKGQTVISDDEIIRKEATSPFYEFQYGPFVIGTVRPETKFADKYIVVHPNDERYAQYKHGQEFEVEWINGPIKATLIKDEVANPDMGSGAMTITPWHSHVDFELAEKYNLDKEQIIDQYGKLLPIAGEEFEGMKIKDAREKIVQKLKHKGLLVGIKEDYSNQLATAERTGGIIEPQIMKQWFIAANKPFILKESHIDGIESGSTVTVKQLMRHVVDTKQVNIIPSYFNKTYYHWIDNLRDWCISRQIWFGHQIPMWYKNGESKVSKTSPGEGWTQDPDTLDTWFSSGLWTFSTLGWPENTKDLQTYHSTSLLETGYDILPFWVARMILMSTTLLGTVPFKDVYLHGLVRDGKGQKISKSLGNNIDPREVAAEYGNDALRMALMVGVGPGQDSKLSIEKIRAYKKFGNKLWNMSRFVFESIGTESVPQKPEVLSEQSQKWFSDFNEATQDITKELLAYKLYLAGEKVYHYLWHTFADEIIEKTKPMLESKETQAEAQYVLYTILKQSLVILHPLMPHITEEIWQHIPKTDSDRDILAVQSWPQT